MSVVVVDIKMMLDKVESSWALTQNTRLQKEHKGTFVSCVLADVRGKGIGIWDIQDTERWCDKILCGSLT